MLSSDTRNPLWAELESDIQGLAAHKDEAFRLEGSWKELAWKEPGFQIYAVNGEWVRTNLSVIFGSGGHGYVHEFIPHDEIWLDVRYKDVRVSWRWFKSTAVHEMTEWLEMSRGISYYEAHLIALKKEVELGLLVDPYEDDMRAPKVLYLNR
jgi:hypothetical protein